VGAKKIKVKSGKFVVMEPTQLEVMRAQRGVIGFDIVTTGTQMHSSLNFKKEQSAVYLLTNFLQELYRKNWTAFNAVITSAGEADNVVCGKAEGKVSVRPKNIKEYKEILAFLQKFKYKNIRIIKSYATEPCESSLVSKGKTAAFFSEMAFFKDSLLFGVGDIAQAHAADEFVRRKDLNQLEKKLLQLISNLEKK